jgi:hypothetical protein
MKKTKTLALCPLCGARKPAAKKSPVVISARARATKKIDTKVIEDVEGESGDDRTADNFAEIIADLHRTL